MPRGAAGAGCADVQVRAGAVSPATARRTWGSARLAPGRMRRAALATARRALLRAPRRAPRAAKCEPARPIGHCRASVDGRHARDRYLPPTVKIRLAAAATLALAAGRPASLHAQDTEPAFVPPVAGTWAPIRSMGQPPRWKPWYGVGLGQGREDGGDVTLFSGSLGVYRDLTAPVTGFLGWQAEAYGGVAGSRLDGGGRLLLRSPLLFLGGGVDYNLRRERLRGVVSLQFPPVRGGLFGRGGDLRLDWLPGEGNIVQLGAQLPLGQRFLGRTRPRRVEVELPRTVRGVPVEPAAPGSAIAVELDAMRTSARWVSRLSFLLWDLLARGGPAGGVVPGTEAGVAALRADLAARDTLPGSAPFQRELARYHAALARAFGLASGAPDSAAQAAGEPLAAMARRIALEEVFLPYNRTIGQPKSPDTLAGLVARAHARFIGWLALRQDAPHEPDHLRVFDAWLAEIEALRADHSRRTGDSRFNWLPMALVLRPGEHRTQEQIDGLVARALARPFRGGNALLYFGAQQFQVELNRSIHEAERYHVLWVHDYRGVDEAGQPDRIGFYQTVLGYLAALTRRVREYDRTGQVPAYLLMLDQYHYDQQDSRRWLDLLERPLDHRVRLPARHAAMAEVLEAWQDSLRLAVAGSRRLMADSMAFGGDWVRQVVKVHVSVTNPADLSFRTSRILGLPFGPDNAMRDHRKIVIRDVSHADLAAGEVIIAGVGVGDLYTAPTWEDRALLLTGPAAADVKEAAREVLLQNGIRDQDLPPPLRESTPPADRAARVAALEAAGATARVLQAHNRTGWGAKDATFVQMLLWDLVPPGTVIYVPDSLWTNALWLAQLLSAALRGCEVFVIAPSVANAPRDGFPSMTATHELFTRLFIVQRDLGEVIRASGGDLRVGLYTRQAPIGMPVAKLQEVDTTYGKYAFLRSQYPFPEATWRMLRDHRAQMDSGRARQEVAPADTAGGRPRLHQKTQFIASRALLEELALQPETHRALDLMLRQWGEGITVTPERGPIPAQRRLEVARTLRVGHDHLPAPVRDSSLLYLAVGSLNKDTRGMALDGEVMALVAGRWALSAYLDFWSLFGSTTWIERVEEIDELIPPYGGLQRWVGHRIRRLM